MAEIEPGKLGSLSGTHETLQSKMEPSNTGVVLRGVWSDFRSPHNRGRSMGIEPTRFQGALG
jgi:hypothetical protein